MLLLRSFTAKNTSCHVLKYCKGPVVFKISYISEEI